MASNCRGPMKTRFQSSVGIVHWTSNTVHMARRDRNICEWKFVAKQKEWYVRSNERHAKGVIDIPFQQHRLKHSWIQLLNIRSIRSPLRMRTHSSIRVVKNRASWWKSDMFMWIWTDSFAYSFNVDHHPLRLLVISLRWDIRIFRWMGFSSISRSVKANLEEIEVSGVPCEHLVPCLHLTGRVVPQTNRWKYYPNFFHSVSRLYGLIVNLGWKTPFFLVPRFILSFALWHKRSHPPL